MIRKIKPSDRQKYKEMAKEFYSSPAVLAPIPDGNFDKTFDLILSDEKYGEIFVFEENGIIKGYLLTAKTYSQEAGGYVLWIEEIFVLPKYRKTGIGDAFLSFCESRMKNEFARLRLEIEPENIPAVNLYKKHGLNYFEYKQMIKE